MRILFLFILVAIKLPVPAQTKPDSICNCSVVFSIQYPKAAEKAKASGRVVIEFEEDENCFWSNPVVIQKAGYGFDEEALRAMNRIIVMHNSCNRKCPVKSCIKSKLKQPFTFTHTEE
jgi:hypothetical protein